jgi:hypothetical protein
MTQQKRINTMKLDIDKTLVKIKGKGQAEIMDGLILMLLASMSSVFLLVLASNYGSVPLEIYENNYANKLAQNTLLSMYHITYLDDPSSSIYQKSIMVGISQELSAGHIDVRATQAGLKIKQILDEYHDSLGWHFLFALTEGGVLKKESIISTDPKVDSPATFNQYAGSPYCAEAALTYPKGSDGSCSVSGSLAATEHEAGDMCFYMFEICVWLP